MSQSPSFTRKKFSRFWERHFHPGALSQSCKCLFWYIPSSLLLSGASQRWKGKLWTSLPHRAAVATLLAGNIFSAAFTPPIFNNSLHKEGSSQIHRQQHTCSGSTLAVLNKQALVALPKTHNKCTTREECWYSCDRSSRTLARWLFHSWSLAHNCYIHPKQSPAMN